MCVIPAAVCAGTAAATTALAAITTGIATTAPGSCLDGYRGPLASYKGGRRFKIGGNAGHITGIASAKLCSKTCDENAKCLAFSHRGDKGVCQLYVSTAIGTLEAHDQYAHYFADSSCGATPPANCEEWCGQHAEHGVDTRCRFTKDCAGCPQCTGTARIRTAGMATAAGTNCCRAPNVQMN